MFTKHRWNILNIQWHPIDDHPAITTALTRSSLLPFVSLTRPSRYPDRDHSPAVTKLLIEHRVTRPHFLSVSLRWKTAATCQQQFAQVRHVVLKHCGRGYRDVSVSAGAVIANVT